MNFLDGYKTYIIAGIAILTAAYQVLGPMLGLPGMVPDWVYTIEAALGLGAVRVAIANQ